MVALDSYRRLYGDFSVHARVECQGHVWIRIRMRNVAIIEWLAATYIKNIDYFTYSSMNDIIRMTEPVFLMLNLKFYAENTAELRRLGTHD